MVSFHMIDNFVMVDISRSAVGCSTVVVYDAGSTCHVCNCIQSVICDVAKLLHLQCSHCISLLQAAFTHIKKLYSSYCPDPPTSGHSSISRSTELKIASTAPSTSSVSCKVAGV